MRGWSSDSLSYPENIIKKYPTKEETMEEVLGIARQNLAADVNRVCEEKIKRVKALGCCTLFISAATYEAAYGEGFSFFGRMRTASEKLPIEFENR